MAIDDHHVDPILPLELQCLILQMALENNMNDPLKLLFISKDVFDWLIQILYKTISLFSQHSFAWPPLPFPITKLPEYGRYVQHLLVMPVPEDVLDQYLRYCSNIIYFGSQASLSHLNLNEPHSPDINDIDLTSLFSKITHLDIEELHIAFLSHFPSLTHLVVHYGVDYVVVFVLAVLEVFGGC
ncbi:hypothetical protein BDN72DRAFT_834164 [Pluteus cervinus]|uniref:Uncharacterized protein n=1 Tax=Pluteus cervinus TaxID=181527 RepID=A0ACD3B7Y7_9AGAR|nr:hypothetical protein BDN72DRAFT_834164 [Pluteus cervinus]